MKNNLITIMLLFTIALCGEAHSTEEVIPDLASSFGYWKENTIHLTGDQTTRFSLPHEGGVLLVHKDFIGYIELIKSDDPEHQKYRTRCYDMRISFGASGEFSIPLGSVDVLMSRDDGSTYTNTLVVGESYTPFINAYVFTVEYSADDRSIVYSPGLVTVTVATEDQFDDRVKKLKDS
jgi:hypothetical protein